MEDNRSLPNQIYDYIANEKKIGEEITVKECAKNLSMTERNAASSLFSLEKRGVIKAISKKRIDKFLNTVFLVEDLPPLIFQRRRGPYKKPNFNGPYLRMKNRKLPIQEEQSPKTKRTKGKGHSFKPEKNKEEVLINLLKESYALMQLAIELGEKINKVLNEKV